MQSSSFLRELPKQSLFSMLPDSLDELSDSFEIIVATPGKTIFKEGEKQDRLILPLTDHLILKSSNDETHLLQKGRTLALLHLLNDTPLPYSVISQNFNRILTLPREPFIAYLNRYPQHQAYLKLITSSASFRNFKNFLEEKNIKLETIMSIASEFKEITLTKDTLIDGFIFLNDKKEIPVLSLNQDHYLTTDRIPAGAWVGGFSLVGSDPCPYRLKLESEEVFLSISHALLRRKLKESQILEEIATDPWMRIERKKQSDTWDLNTQITAIQVLEKIPMPMDPDLFLYGTSDIDALPKTVFNLINYLGNKTDLSEIDLLLRNARPHFTVNTLGSVFEANEFQTRPFKFQLDQEIFSPVLLFKGNRLIVLLKKVTQTEFLCMDALDGFYKTASHSLLEFEDQNLIYALLVETPLRIEDPAESIQKISLHFIFQVLAESKKHLTFITLCAIIIFALTALVPYLSQLLLDEVLRTSDSKTLWMCFTGMLISSLGIILFDYLKNRYANILSLAFDQKFSSFIYKKALELNPQDLSRIQVGGILNRIAESEKIRNFFSTESINKAISLISVIVYLSILAFYSIYIALLPLAYLVILYFIQKIFRKRIYRFELDHFNMGTKMNTFISESISKVLAIKAFSAARKISTEWDQIVVQGTEASQKAIIETAKVNALVETLSQATQIGAIWLSVSLLFTQKGNGFSAGQLLAVTQYISRVINPMGGLVSFVIGIADVKLSLDKINDILFPSGKYPLTPLKRHSVPLEGKIRLERVSFRYEESDPWVLKDLSLSIYPGQTIALIGKSGSGKTTLANLIAGDIEPTTGKIFFDHFDKSFIDLNYLKSQIGYVQQSNELFAGSIKSNIAYKDDAPEAQLLSFAKKYSSSESFIGEFPQGEETYLAEGGMGLSGGQKQRISIARVLYTNPKIMILDEATSALDSESESAVVKNIKELAKNRTTIIIAHRLTTIKDADVIFVLDGGSLVQQGTHNQLILAEGVYRELFKDQAE